MIPSAHARYREQLEWLADDARVVSLLPDGGWRRTYARFEPDREPFAVMVYESVEAVLRVDAFDTPVVTPYWRDQALPSLAGLVDGMDWRVARYLPGRRCTLRTGDSRYVKVYSDQRGQRVDAAGRQLWSAAQSGELDIRVPEPDRWDAPTGALWQHELCGKPIAAALYGSRGADVAYRVGHAAAALARSSIQPGRVFDGAAQMARSAQIGHELTRRVSGLEVAVQTILGRLAAVHAAGESRAPRPIHGDPHADQWLECDGQLGLLDFESVALDDPELDAAVFLAELEFEEQRQTLMEEMEEAYLRGACRGAVPLDLRLLRAYLGHQRLFKALRAARAVRPDGDERAARHLERALELV